MTALLNVLLDFADRTMVRDLLRACGYWSASHRLNDDWNDFQKTLSPEQNARLDALLEQETALQARDAEAVFQSGLSIGLELSRLSLTSPQTPTRTPCP